MRRACVNCRRRPPRWRPDYSPHPQMFCTQRCAAEYAHELVAEPVAAGDPDPAAEDEDPRPSVTVRRRDGFYEITIGSRYYQAERRGRTWKLRQWYGPLVGWADDTVILPTLRACKERVRDLHAD